MTDCITGQLELLIDMVLTDLGFSSLSLFLIHCPGWLYTAQRVHTQAPCLASRFVLEFGLETHP